MDLIFIKIKDSDGDTDLLNVRAINDITPSQREKGKWEINMKNGDSFFVSDEVYYLISGAIQRSGLIVDCTGNRDRVLKTLDGDHPKNADSPRHITFD